MTSLNLHRLLLSSILAVLCGQESSAWTPNTNKSVQRVGSTTRLQMNPFSAYLQLFEETTTKKASTDTDASLPSNKRTDHNIGQYYSKNFASSLEAKV